MKPPLRTVLKNFLNHFEDYEARKKLCDDQYEYEFQQLKNVTDKLREDPDYPSTCATKDVNRPKNRYRDIVPYDKSRVILPKCDGVPGSDYINASYVKGASGAFAYIAAQGPLPNTVIDFWRMIWICDVQVLVMACNEKEAGKSKCEAYWPLKGEVMHYGNISVELIETSQVCPDFMIRTLLVKCDSEMRDVYQFHYTTWPDHGVPETVNPILELVRLVRDCQATEIMPVLVHCSAGCGRTGTICAVDYVWACLRQGKLAEDFSLFQICLELRRQRIAMIQTKEQYMLAHKAVATLFEQQLNVIDCHTYVNVDEDGEPLMWKELSNNIVPQFKKEKSYLKESSPPKNFTKGRNKEERASTNGITNKPAVPNPSLTDSSQGSSVIDMLESQSSSNIKLSSKMSISDSLVNSSKNSETSFSRNSYLSQQSNEDSIPFIDEDEVCVRPNCGRDYLNLPSCDSIMNHFDPFVDKVTLDTDDSSPDTDPNAFPQKLLDFQSSSSKHGEKETKDSFKLEKSDQIITNTYSTLPSSSCSKNKSHPGVNNRESYPPSASGLSRFHDDSISDLADGSADSLKGSKKVGKGTVVRRPSISKLKALFEKSGISFKSSNEGGKRSLFRNNSHSVSRAGSAPPSLNCMDKTAAVERESILKMVTRKFRSASVRNEREISSKPYEKSEQRKSSPGAFKEGFATLSRTVSFNLSKTFRSYSPAKTKAAKSSIIEAGHVSFAEVNPTSETSKLSEVRPTSETSKSKLPEVQPKGKSMWYDKSSLPRAVAVVKPTEKTYLNVEVPKSPTEKHDPEKQTFASVINKPPKLLPFFSTLNRTNGKEVSAMWYSEPEETSLSTESTNFKINYDSNSKLPYKSQSNNRVLPFIHSIQPWKKAASKSPLSSPDSPKSLVAMNLEPNTSTSNSKFYTGVEVSIKESHIPPSQRQVQDAPACPIPEEIIPLCIAAESSTLKTNDPVTTLNVLKTSSSGTNLSSNSEVAIVEHVESPTKSVTENDLCTKTSQDFPPAIPKKLGKHKQLEKLKSDTSLSFCADKNDSSKVEDSLKPVVKEKVESVPTSPKDHYINVNVKAQKNIEQIENTLRNNPRGAIIDLTSRESYCMEEELHNALRQLSKPSDGEITAPKNTKFPGYEVIWPEVSYSGGDFKQNSGISHCKTGLCYSPPLRRSVNTTIGLVKCNSCSNIDWLEPNECTSLVTSKEPLTAPNKQHFTDAVVELNTLLDKLTTRTLTEETEFDKKVKTTLDHKAAITNCGLPIHNQNEKDNSATHAVTLLSKSNTSHGSPPKEEEIIFHFPPPPPLPPPDDEPISETFNIMRKNGSLVVSETSKTKDSATDTSCSENNKLNAMESNDNSVPQPTPRRSKQVSGLRRSASYTNVFPQQSKSGYENVFLEKYQTISRLQIDSKVDDKKEDNPDKGITLKSKPRTGKVLPNYVNIDSMKMNVENTKHATHSPLKQTDMSSSCPPSAFYVDDSAGNKFSAYGKLIKMPDKRLPISEERLADHRYYSAENLKKKPVPSKKSERAPLPPELACSLQTKENKSDSQKLAITRKFPSRKLEKAPLPPPLLQKSALAISAAKNLQNRPNYVNFPSRTHVDETQVLPALHENIANNEITNNAIGINLRTQKDFKSNHFVDHGLSHSQSDASVFLALKERKSRSLGRGLRGLDSKQHVVNKMLKQNKEFASVSSSDSDSSYERIFFDNPKEQSKKDISIRNIKEQIMLNSAKSYRKEMPVAPPRARRRNTTEINYAKVKSKEASPAAVSSIQDQEKCAEELHVPESPPAIPLKTKDAFEVPRELNIKGGSSQRTVPGVKPSESSFKR